MLEWGSRKLGLRGQLLSMLLVSYVGWWHPRVTAWVSALTSRCAPECFQGGLEAAQPGFPPRTRFFAPFTTIIHFTIISNNTYGPRRGSVTGQS